MSCGRAGAATGSPAARARPRIWTEVAREHGRQPTRHEHPELPFAAVWRRRRRRRCLRCCPAVHRLPFRRCRPVPRRMLAAPPAPDAPPRAAVPPAPPGPAPAAPPCAPAPPAPGPATRADRTADRRHADAVSVGVVGAGNGDGDLTAGDVDVSRRDHVRRLDHRGPVHERRVLDHHVNLRAEERRRLEALDDDLNGAVVDAAEEDARALGCGVHVREAVQRRAAGGVRRRRRHHVARHVAVPLVEPPPAVRVGVRRQQTAQASRVPDVPERDARAVDAQPFELRDQRRRGAGLTFDGQVAAAAVLVDRDRQRPDAQLLLEIPVVLDVAGDVPAAQLVPADDVRQAVVGLAIGQERSAGTTGCNTRWKGR